jgi:DNA-binding transcriptional LysR family regulator
MRWTSTRCAASSAWPSSRASRRRAEQLGTPKARVSQHVARLETDLGTRLLHRTTRAVRLSPDGERFLARARALVHDADDALGMFKGRAALSGGVRIDMPVGLARNAIIPSLSEFLDRHRRLDLQLSCTDRVVDVVREGFDAVVRVAALTDSSLVVKRLGTLAMVNAASPAYLARNGVPRQLDDLDTHRLVHYSASLNAERPEFEYHDGRRWRARPMGAALTVNNADAFATACRTGLGIAQLPRIGVADALLDGSLVEILPRHVAAPLPVWLLHPHGRDVALRVRAVLDWISSVLRPHLAEREQTRRGQTKRL